MSRKPRVTLKPLAEDCNSVEVWFEEIGLSVEFSAKGCVHLRMFSNGAKPDITDDEIGENVDYMHACDLGPFIAALQTAQGIAKKEWKPI